MRIANSPCGIRPSLQIDYHRCLVSRIAPIGSRTRIPEAAQLPDSSGITPQSVSRRRWGVKNTVAGRWAKVQRNIDVFHSWIIILAAILLYTRLVLCYHLRTKHSTQLSVRQVSGKWKVKFPSIVAWSRPWCDVPWFPRKENPFRASGSRSWLLDANHRDLQLHNGRYLALLILTPSPLVRNYHLNKYQPFPEQTNRLT